MSDFQLSEDAEVLYQGNANVKSYGSSATSEPYIGLNKLELEQFDYIRQEVDPNTPVICIIGNGTEIVWNCEMQLKNIYDNVRDKWVKLAFKFDQDMIDSARDIVDMDDDLDVTIIKGQICEKPKKKKGDHGKYASQLIQSNLLTKPSFWNIVGSEDRYLHWLRRQPCLITRSGVRQENGEDLCEAAHVRDVKYGSGIATKPEYFAVPLHPDIHAEQHQKGVYNMWQRAGRPTPSQIQYPINDEKDHVRQWLQITTIEYIKRWIQHEIKEYFSVDSMSFISEEKFEQYVKEKAPPNAVERILELSRERRDLSFLSGENND